MRFEGRVAVVTGAGTGIGRAVSLRLAAEGASVALVGRRRDPLVEVADLIASAGGHQAAVLPADVSSPEELDEVVATVLDRWGRLDVAVASAGVSLRRAYLETDPADLDRLLAVNVRGVYVFGQVAARAMIAGSREAGGAGAAKDGGGAPLPDAGGEKARADAGVGVIVNIGSTNGLAADEVLSESAYNASKGAVVALTKSMALELAPLGIRVNAVCPGWIVTPLTERLSADPEFQAAYLRKIPLGRFGRPEEVATCVAFLASNDASFVTGVCLVADGGQLTF